MKTEHSSTLHRSNQQFSHLASSGSAFDPTGWRVSPLAGEISRGTMSRDVASGSSTSFQAQAAHFRFSPDSGHIAASHRSATKSADARRGAAHGGELHQAAGAAALVAADERGVRWLQPQTLKGGARRNQPRSVALTTGADALPVSKASGKWPSDDDLVADRRGVA